MSNDHAGDERESGNDLEVDQRFHSYATDLLHVTDGSDTLHDCAEDHGRDHHFDQSNEAIAQRFERNSGAWEEMTDKDAKKNCQHDLRVENGVPGPTLWHEVLDS
jgi:hypothetical protein